LILNKIAANKIYFNLVTKFRYIREQFTIQLSFCFDLDIPRILIAEFAVSYIGLSGKTSFH